MTLLLLSLMACGDKDTPGDSDPVVTDVDNDGYDGVDHGGDDCDDDNPDVNPGADELCDTIDNNCDGTVDEDSAVDASTWYQDADSDGYGSDVSAASCSQPSGYVAETGDCDDGEAAAYPGADEICDTIDNNCNGAADEVSAVDAPTWYTDNDGDTYGDANYPYTSCEAPTGYVADSTDCDDTDASINTAGTEVCDDEDNDCDGEIDEDDAVDAATWWVDADGDGHGVDTGSTLACNQPSGYADNTDDCNDGDGSISPDGIEICDSVDNDCDGDTDEADAIDATTWYYDSDGDSYGDASVSETACSHTSGYVDDDTDCDDSTSAVNPGVTETCNEIDDDCDGTTDEPDASDASTWYADDDSDGYGDSGDSKPACDQPSGYVADSSDCDDTEGTTNPGADEICEDSVDNDCDRTTDECAIQGDLDADSEAWIGLYGETIYDYAGSTVAGVGDVNNDGYDDFAVSAPGYDASSNEGRVYLFYGATTASTLSGADVVVTGSTSNAGLGLGNALLGGDITGDGTDDLIIGASSWDENATNAGAVYLYAGGALSSASTATAFIEGTTNSAQLGIALGVGDLNNDGYDDLTVGGSGFQSSGDNHGGAFTFFGPISAANNLSQDDNDVALYGVNEDDQAGYSLAFVGDTNGDGADDLAVGARYVGSDAGAAYLVLGPITAGGTSTDLATVGLTLSASASEDLAGSVVRSAGDVNNDGYDDTLVTAPFNDDGGTDAGAAYVVYGPVSASMGLGSADAVLTGEAASDNFGISASGLDADGDGSDDVLVGAYRNDDSASNAGAAYLWYGPLSGTSSASAADADITGTTGGDQLGYSVSNAGDLDGDGFDDLIAGARRESTTDTYAGAAYLFQGDER